MPLSYVRPTSASYVMCDLTCLRSYINVIDELAHIKPQHSGSCEDCLIYYDVKLWIFFNTPTDTTSTKHSVNHIIVYPTRFELATSWLKVRSSTSWATGTYYLFIISMNSYIYIITRCCRDYPKQVLNWFKIQVTPDGIEPSSSD